LKKNCKTIALALMLGLNACLAAAQDLQVNAALALGAWSGTRVLDQGGGVFARTLSAGAGMDLGERLRIKLDGSIHQFPQRRRALREAWVQWEGERTQLRLGHQILAWGRADRINPTDNLTARDYTLPLAVDEAQRIGAPSFTLLHELGQAGRLTLVAKRFRASRGPSDEAERHLPVRVQGEQTEYAVKFDRTGEALDWSLSYFDGLEKLRSLQLLRAPGGRIVGASRGHAPLRALGVDAAATVGAWGLRGELARLRFRETRFDSLDGRLSHWYGIAGVETSLPHSAGIAVQYFFRRYGQDPGKESSRRRLRIANNQFHRLQDGFTLRYAQRLWNDRIDYELVAMHNLREGDWAFRPRVNLRWSDRIKFTAGADVFRGREESFFGSIEKNTVGFAEVVFIY
jgi:hypothetical protein